MRERWVGLKFDMRAEYLSSRNNSDDDGTANPGFT